MGNYSIHRIPRIWGNTRYDYRPLAITFTRAHALLPWGSCLAISPSLSLRGLTERSLALLINVSTFHVASESLAERQGVEPCLP